MMIRPVAAALVALIVALPASAATFFDGFETETAGPSILNYAGFANWSVNEGTVDLVRSGQFGISCRTGNYCVDLDGSTFQPGAFTLADPIPFLAGDRISVSFWISGNQRNGALDGFDAFLSLGDDPVTLDQLVVTIAGVDIPAGGLTANALAFEDGVPGARAFLRYGWQFRALTPGFLQLTLEDEGADNVGVILDDVSIQATGVPIPEPATWAMLIAGFGLVGAAARRRRPAAA